MANKVFLSPTFNILVSIFLLSAFFMAGKTIVQTYAVANMAALVRLRPQPMDYFWELNIHQAPLNKNKIRYYADYYEHLLQVFPGLWDAYGVLGFCYHDLNDDPKAIKFFKLAIANDPDYFWNYYDLAAIDINETRYQEAVGILQKAMNLDPMTSLKRMFTSPMVYGPLLGPDIKDVFMESAKHLKKTLQSSAILIRVLKQAETSPEMREDLGKINLELYLF